MNIKPAVLLFLTLFTAQIYGRSEKVVIIGAYHKGYEWSDNCIKGLYSVLSAKYTVKTFYMDTKRLPEEKHDEAVKKAWKFIEEEKPDLILLGDDNSLKYLGPKLADTNIPVVFYGINENPRIYFSGQLPSNITGVLERPLISQSLRYIKKLLPDIRKTAAFFDVSSTTRAVFSTVFLGKKSLKALGVTMDFIEISTFEEWKQFVISLKQRGYDVLLINTFFTLKDKNGAVVDPVEVVKWTSLNTPVPLFCTNGTAMIQTGAIGALLLKGENHGKLAGNIADQILMGQAVSELPFIRDEEGVLYFNKKELERFNIILPREINNGAVIQ